MALTADSTRAEMWMRRAGELVGELAEQRKANATVTALAATATASATDARADAAAARAEAQAMSERCAGLERDFEERVAAAVADAAAELDAQRSARQRAEEEADRQTRRADSLRSELDRLSLSLRLPRFFLRFGEDDLFRFEPLGLLLSPFFSSLFCATDSSWVLIAIFPEGFFSDLLLRSGSGSLLRFRGGVRLPRPRLASRLSTFGLRPLGRLAERASSRWRLRDRTRLLSSLGLLDFSLLREWLTERV